MSLPKCLESNINKSKAQLYCAPFFTVQEALAMLPLLKLTYSIDLNPSDITQTLIEESTCSIQNETKLYCGLCHYSPDNIIKRQQQEIEVLKYAYHTPSFKPEENLFQYYTIENGEKVLIHQKLFSIIQKNLDLTEFPYIKGTPKTLSEINEIIDQLKNTQHTVSNNNTDISALIDEKLSNISSTTLSAYKRGPIYIKYDAGQFHLSSPKFDSHANIETIEQVFSNPSYLKIYSSVNLLESKINFGKNIYNKLIDVEEDFSIDDFEKLLPTEKSKIFTDSQYKFITRFHNTQKKSNFQIEYDETNFEAFTEELLKALITQRLFHQYPLWVTGVTNNSISFCIESHEKHRMYRGCTSKIIRIIRQCVKKRTNKKFAVKKNP